MFDPEGYQGTKEIPNQLNFEFVPKLTNQMSWNFKDGNFLDYGCGPGSTGFQFIFPFVESTNSQLYSVDVSSKMVEFAEEKFPHSRIHYQHGYFPDNFPFWDVKFDWIFSINVFYYARDVDTILKSMVSLLKPGGQLGFTTTTVNTVALAVLRHLIDCPDWAQYMAGCKEHIGVWSDYKPETNDPEAFFRKIFVGNTGLKEIHFEYLSTQINPEMLSFLDVNLSMNPCLPNVPNNLQNELREEYRRFITSYLGVPLTTKKVTAPLEYIYAVLEKPTL